jgi:uncharacterized protein (DUF1015 family)
MNLIRPFAGLRPAPGRAAEVIAPPYDVLSAEEARVRAKDRPWSFLHISKPEIDLPPGTDPYAPGVYAKARESFECMRREGVLRPDPEPYYYIYRLTRGAHTQTGLVAAASVAAYEHGRIRRHEFTRPDKEDDRVRQITSLNAQTGPVFLVHRHNAGIDAMIEIVARGRPDVDVTADDGVRHSLWVAHDRKLIRALTAAFEGLERLYIADGHHRAAAAARVAAARPAPPPPGERCCDYFLSVIFPDDQVQILDYNRVVKDLQGLTREVFLARVGEAFELAPVPAAHRPSRAGEFGMYLSGRWYRLAIKARRVPKDDPVRRLDVSLLQEHLLAPVLGIGDPRTDKRIDFVGGIRGLAELERRVDSGEMAVAFALYPTAIADMMAVADAGAVMPPKSTWFEPKLADGLVSHRLE